MTISLEGIGKKYTAREWVFKDVNQTFENNRCYAVTGSNGSGKTTLTKIISGILPASIGTISYQLKNKNISSDEIYQHLSYASPYLELIEEFSLSELMEFHFKFKKVTDGMNISDIMEKMYLTEHTNKRIAHFSSGMKQRLKLGLALYSQAEVTILDEPTSNLDERGISWYFDEMKGISNTRVVIIASNQPYEYEFADEIITLNK